MEQPFIRNIPSGAVFRLTEQAAARPDAAAEDAAKEAERSCPAGVIHTRA